MTKSKRVAYKKSDLIAWLTDRFGQDFSSLEPKLPPIIWRSKWDIFSDKLGLPYTKGYMQFLDFKKKGPLDYNSRLRANQNGYNK